MAEGRADTQVVIAIVGLIGLLGTATIKNWDKIFGPKSPERPPIGGPPPLPIQPAIIPKEEPPKVPPVVESKPECIGEGEFATSLPSAPPKGCVLLTESYYGTAPATLTITTIALENMHAGILGHWWYVYPQRVMPHRDEFKQKCPACDVQDLRR